MAKINDYYEKKQLMEQLANELEQLENDTALKADLEFENDVKDLMKKHEKSPRDVLQILAAMDPAISLRNLSIDARAKRPLRTYKNPHTGEVVKTRGGNHKTLNEWREKYGKETVQSWAS